MVPVKKNNPSYAVAMQTYGKNKGQKPKHKSASRAESPPGGNKQHQYVTKAQAHVGRDDQVNTQTQAARRGGFGTVGPMITKHGYGR